jgi:hypothetical protein
MFNQLKKCWAISATKAKTKSACHGDIMWHGGLAYVFRNRSQYRGWYSALTGKRLHYANGIKLSYGSN